MIYATPQTYNTNNQPSSYGNMRAAHDTRATTAVRQSIARAFPRSTVLEIFYGKDGKPTKAYIRDDHGRKLTVVFNDQQHIVRTEAGLR